MKWLRWTGAAVAGCIIILVGAALLVPDQPPSTDRSALPSFPAALTSGKVGLDTIELPVDLTGAPKGLVVSAFGHRILQLSEAYRDRAAELPSSVKKVVIYGEMELFDEGGKATGKETILRAYFDRERFLAAGPPYNLRNVLQLAKHTNFTAVAARNDLLHGFCESPQGGLAGDLCS